MPKRTGLEVLKAIRATGAKVPIVIVSTEANQREIMAAIDAGVSEYLVKPFTIETRLKLESLVRAIKGRTVGARSGPVIDAKYGGSFLVNTMSVFEAMFGCTLSRGEPFCDRSSQPIHDISGLIELKGKVEGSFLLSLSRSVAMAAVMPVMGKHPTTINDDVIDVVGELTNIIAGNSQAQFDKSDLCISTPKVLIGKSHCVEFPEGVIPTCIPFKCEWGPVAVQLGLFEHDVEAHVGT